MQSASCNDRSAILQRSLRRLAMIVPRSCNDRFAILKCFAYAKNETKQTPTARRQFIRPKRGLARDARLATIVPRSCNDHFAVLKYFAYAKNETKQIPTARRHFIRKANFMFPKGIFHICESKYFIPQGFHLRFAQISQKKHPLRGAFSSGAFFISSFLKRFLKGSWSRSR